MFLSVNVLVGRASEHNHGDCSQSIFLPSLPRNTYSCTTGHSYLGHCSHHPGRAADYRHLDPDHHQNHLLHPCKPISSSHSFTPSSLHLLTPSLPHPIIPSPLHPLTQFNSHTFHCFTLFYHASSLSSFTPPLLHSPPLHSPLLHAFSPSLPSPSYLLSFTPSLLHASSPSRLFSFIPPLLHASSPSFLLSFTPPLLHSSSPSCLLSFTPPLLHSPSPPSLTPPPSPVTSSKLHSLQTSPSVYLYINFPPGLP